MRILCRLYIISLFLVLSAPSWARERAQGYCQQGAVSVSITSLSGYGTTPKVMGATPSCTVTVYLAGTITPAVLYSDTNGTARSNPFTADTTGFWYFYADNGHYDVVMGGSGMTTTTQGDRLLSDLSGTNAAGQINYQRLNTGTVRTIQSKLDERASVFDFGAKGDGTTDDRAAIQAALNAMAATCGTVLFPAGYTFVVASNPGGSSLLTYPPCVSMVGPGTIKVGNNLGAFDALFKPSGSTIGPATIANLTIDMNGANNVINTAPGTTNRQTAFYFLAGGAYDSGGSGLIFDGDRFLNGHGVWTIYSNSPNVQVRGCLWDNWGVGTTMYFDSSNLYLDGDGTLVANNVFNGVFSSEAHTAIEVHRSNKTVVGNTIKNFYIGIIYSADQASGSTVARNITISGNTINRSSTGIQFWTSDGALDSMALNNNTIYIDRNNTAFPPSGVESGIYWYALSSFPVSNVSISNNAISFASDTSSNPAQPITSGLSIAAGSSISGMNITGNTISNAPATGIYFSPGSGASSVTITGNVIRNIGQKNTLAGAYRSGIFLVGIATWSGSTISNNTMTDDQVTATMFEGLYFAGTIGDRAATQLRVRNNSVFYLNLGSSLYYVFSTTSPFFDVEIPGYSTNNGLLVISASAGNYAPIYSTITDTVNGRIYHNLTTPAQAPYFNSQELRDTIPTSGSYKQGDIVWAADSTIAGFAGWVNVFTGSPGTFAKIPLTNAGSNSPFTSNVNGPGFLVTGGTATVYRCLTAGTLPVGALTTLAGTCGTTQTVGLTVQ